MLGYHNATLDNDGNLLPWKPWNEVLSLELEYFARAPNATLGFPMWVYNTFMSDNYSSLGDSIIPGSQVATGIMSYVKVYELTGNSSALSTAVMLGWYLSNYTNTWDIGVWPRFTRATGINWNFPLEFAAQGDAAFGPDCIEPDKGAIAAVAFLKLFNYTKEPTFFNQALHNARLLSENFRIPSESESPWPFRLDSVFGYGFGFQKNGNSVYPLEMFDILIEEYNYVEFQKNRDILLKWIMEVQIPSTNNQPDSCHWVNFFEDILEPQENNRNSWTALRMAHYLIRRKEKTDKYWKDHVTLLLDYSLKNFGGTSIGNVTVMGEQDADHKPWGGACSNLVSVATMFGCSGGPEYYQKMGILLLNHMTYYVRDDGCPAPLNQGVQVCGGDRSWLEDAHFDKVHNWVDAMVALQSCS